LPKTAAEAPAQGAQVSSGKNRFVGGYIARDDATWTGAYDAAARLLASKGTTDICPTPSVADDAGATRRTKAKGETSHKLCADWRGSKSAGTPGSACSAHPVFDVSAFFPAYLAPGG
jgi:hypothetical protein